MLFPLMITILIIIKIIIIQIIIQIIIIKIIIIINSKINLTQIIKPIPIIQQIMNNYNL